MSHATSKPSLAVEGLGSRFELLAKAYKPYARGIVIHPTLDAKFRSPARLRLSPGKVEQQLPGLCRGVASPRDVGQEISAVLHH